MKDLSYIDYTFFDKPEILSCIFYPREENCQIKSVGTEELLIPVEDGFFVGARLHHIDKKAPVILYFHGNGEIVSDYDEIAPLYLDKGMNFLPVDYRGYGRSTGKPTITAMMRDAHIIFEFVKNWLKEYSFTGHLIIMGRSLGSASALEVAVNYEDQIDGLIIESGFAYTLPLLNTLGVDVSNLKIAEKKGFQNIDKAVKFKKRFLVIHAEFDHIIPFSEGKALFDASFSTKKKMLMIPNADHNSVFVAGFNDYMKAVKELTDYQD